MDQFAGYKILERLGAGATAKVYKAQRPEGPVVALKVLDEQGLPEQIQVRFQREVQAMVKLRHPGILQILDHGQEGAQFWYAMEYSQKRDLHAMFEARQSGGGSFTIEECLRLAHGLADSLTYLHEQRIIHRDLKPENLLVDEQMNPTLVDFGLAKDFDRSELTAEGMILGTPRYMAPEQTQGRPAGASADVYQAALILYKSLTGALPLEDQNPFATAMRRMREAIPPPSLVRPTIPPGIDRILLKALKFRAEDRYQDMGEFRSDLAKLDRTSGQLRAGQTMPGSLAEKSVMVGGDSGVARDQTFVTPANVAEFARLAKDGTHPGKGKKEPPPPLKNPALWLAAGLLMAVLAVPLAIMSVRSQSAPIAAPTIQDLSFEFSEAGASLSFVSNRRARSFLQLDPPSGRRLPVMSEAATIHAAQFGELTELDAGSYQILLETKDGVVHALDPASLGDIAAGASVEGVGVQVERLGDRATVQFETDEDSTCRIRYGRGDSRTLDGTALKTGGRRHIFQIRDLIEGVEYTFEVEAESDGTVRRSPPQALKD